MNYCASLLLLAIAGCAGAADVSMLPLDKGTYILDGAGANCAAAPNAATLYFDGNSILGPHGEPCTSKITAVDGQRYTVNMACVVLMQDGTVLPELKTMIVDVDGRTRFSTQHGQGAVNFHRCGAYPAPPPLRAEFRAR